MFNFNLRFPFQSFFFLDRYRFFLNLTVLVESEILFFFLTVIAFFFFSWPLSWSKACFPTFSLLLFFKFPPQLYANIYILGSYQDDQDQICLTRKTIFVRKRQVQIFIKGNSIFSIAVSLPPKILVSTCLRTRFSISIFVRVCPVISLTHSYISFKPYKKL